MHRKRTDEYREKSIAHMLRNTDFFLLNETVFVLFTEKKGMPFVIFS